VSVGDCGYGHYACPKNSDMTSGLQKDVFLPSLAQVTYVRTICLASLLLFLEACSVTEQTPDDVGRKFEEGIKGKGKIVPNDKDHSQTSPSNNSPVTQPAGSSQL
jgi:hypothetical protein